MLGLGFLQLAAKEKMKKFGVEERAVPVHGDTGDIAPFRRDFFSFNRAPPSLPGYSLSIYVETCNYGARGGAHASGKGGGGGSSDPG